MSTNYSTGRNGRKPVRPIIWVLVACILLLTALLIFYLQKEAGATPQPSSATTITAPTPAATAAPVVSAAPATAAPTVAPVSNGPGPEDAQGINEGVQLPKSSSWLSSYEKKTIRTEKGIRAYYLYKPQKVTGPSDVFSYINDGTEVTILARENGFSFVKVAEGTCGWVSSEDLTGSVGSSSSPSAADAQGINEGVQLPQSSSWLSSYEKKTIRTEKGIRAYYLYKPQRVTGPSDVFSYINDGIEVTILARENGFSFVKVAEGTCGWVKSEDLADY